LITIYHNPSCSKSCKAISILDEFGADFKVIDYLSDPPTEKELRGLLLLLNILAEDLIRKNEPVFLEKYVGSVKSEDEWISIMCQNPVLIQRPVLVDEKRAIIGRPAEKIIEFLK